MPTFLYQFEDLQNNVDLYIVATVLVHHIYVDVILTTERNDWCLTLTFFHQFADLERYMYIQVYMYIVQMLLLQKYKSLVHHSAVTIRGNIIHCN